MLSKVGLEDTRYVSLSGTEKLEVGRERQDDSLKGKMLRVVYGWPLDVGT